MSFRVGQKVIFTAKPSYPRATKNDSGKVATIVKCYTDQANIYIPGSVTWHVPYDTLKLLPNTQLLFAFFME